MPLLDDLERHVRHSASETWGVAEKWHESWAQAFGPAPPPPAPSTLPSQRARSGAGGGSTGGAPGSGSASAAAGPSAASAPAAPTTLGQDVASGIRRAQSVVSAVMGLINLPQDMMNVGFANLTNPIASLFPSLPAATILMPYLGMPHAHAHPPSFIPPAPPVPLPSLGMVMLGTHIKTLINYMPAARAGDIGVAITCGGIFPFFQILTGSSNVFIGGNRAARMLDVCLCCTQAKDDRKIDAGKLLAMLGKLARGAAMAIEIGGHVAGALGVAANIAEAAVEDDPAMESAKVLAAAMDAGQMAADIAAKALTKSLGKDPGIPPGSIGAILFGSTNVLIGGFPMINFPNPVSLLLEKLGRFVPAGGAEEESLVGAASCPIPA